jgi:hypothetical protein
MAQPPGDRQHGGSVTGVTERDEWDIVGCSRSLWKGGITMTARRRLLGGASVAVAIALLVGVLALSAGPARARTFATLQVLSGTVEVRTEGAAGFLPAGDGDVLAAGDVVRTGTGRAAIEYFDGSVTRLDRGTTFVLEELSDVNGAPDGKVVVGRHPTGRTFNRVRALTESDSRFQVGTPTAIASVRGTVFFTEAGEDGTDLVGVLHGAVVVRDDDEGYARVRAGRFVRVDEDGVSSPAPLGDLRTSPWVLYNLCILDLVAECEGPAPDQDEVAEPVASLVSVATFGPSAPGTPSPESSGQGATGGARAERDDGTSDPVPPPAPSPAPEPEPEPEPDPGRTPPGNPPCENPGQGDPCNNPGNGNPGGQGS